MSSLTASSSCPTPDQIVQCFHCGEQVPTGLDLNVEYQGKEHPTCCVGCQQIASTIISSGMEDYYKFRTEYASPPDVDLGPVDRELHGKLTNYDLPEVQEEFVERIDTDKKNGSANSSDLLQAKLSIQGISCAACIWLLERYIKRLSGVHNATLNLTQHTALITWDPEQIKLSDILAVVYQIGYQAFPFDPKQVEDQIRKESQKSLRRILVAGLGTMQAMMFAVPLYVGEWSYIADQHQFAFRLASLLMTIPVVFYAAAPFFVAAKRDLITRHLTMDVPVSIAIGFAFIASTWITFTGGDEVYFDSVCMFTFFLSIGRYLEMRARHKAGIENNRLTNAFPDTATIIKTASKDESEPSTLVQGTNQTIDFLTLPSTVVPAKQLKVGERVLVKAGESVPVDGIILQGESQLDESLLTGEFEPVSKGIGESVLAGSTNVDQPIVFECTKSVAESQMSSIQRLLEQAQSNKPAIALIADKVAQYFVATVLIVATLVTAYWLYQSPDQALGILLSVLVVTCPCALSLATPTALTVAGNRLMEHGILITKGTALENISKADWLIFDKTGTLTEGKFSLYEQWTAPNWTFLNDGFENLESRKQALYIAASLEQASEHPIATAFKQSSETIRSELGLLAIENLEIVNGQGIMGTINGQIFKIGKYSFCTTQTQSDSLTDSDLGTESDTESNSQLLGQETNTSTNIESSLFKNQQFKTNLTETGVTHIFLSQDNQLIAEFGLKDMPKQGIDRILSKLSERYKLALLTGDGSPSAQTFGDSYPFDLVCINQTPEQKLEQIEKLQTNGNNVVMVGDGINDLPVIGQAQTSIAMGSGADLTKHSSDVVLLKNRLDSIDKLYQTSSKTTRVIKQNITWSLMYNATTLPLAALGLIPPWMAAIGMSFSSLLVVLNALRLKSA